MKKTQSAMAKVTLVVLEGILAIMLLILTVYFSIFGLFFTSLTLGDWWSKNHKTPWEKVIERELDIEIEGGLEEDYIETHGGFLGDGLTYIRVDFSGTEFETLVKDKEAWRETPLTENIHTMLYGNETWNGIKYSHDFVLPEVENGYYYFLDRQSDSLEDTDLMNRWSYNFTFTLYDLDETKLYFIKFDT